MTLAITFKVLATGSQNVSGLIYDYSGSSYHYNDDGGSEPNLLTVTAAYGPTAPDAANDSVTTNEDTSVDINFLANGTDVNGNLNAPSLSVATRPSNGTDSFTYEVCDVAGLCDTAVVDITVNSVNDGPDAVDDVAAGVRGADIGIDILANDSDPDGAIDDTSVSVTSGPSNGTATVVLDIWLRDPSRRPNAVDDSATAPEDTPVTINVRGNDTDPDGDPLTIGNVSQPKHGSVARSGGRLVFTPDGNWHGTTSFTYTECDPGGRCDDAVVTVTVNPVDDGPDEFSYEICDPDGDCSEATVFVEVNGSSVPPREPNQPNEPEPAPQPGQLPHTGGDVTRLALWGVTLLLMGTALVLRRRTRLG